MSRSLVSDIRACLRLYSRLPVGAEHGGHAMPDLSEVGWAIPVAGMLIGGTGAIAVGVARVTHLPPLLTAAVAIGVLILTTGAIHEDGLADMADGFGGGATRDDKLAIMRDSRLGAYGAIALCVTILMRVAALLEIVERGVLPAAAALVAVGAVSRVAGLLPLITLAPARADGAGAAAAMSSHFWARALFVAGCVGFCPWFTGASLSQIIVAQAMAYAASATIAQLARRQIGGYTGDVLGAAQQAAETAALAALAAY